MIDRYKLPTKYHGIRCRVCKSPWVPDARHVDTDGCVKDCKPDDNLVYLEYLYEQSVKLQKKEPHDETQR